LPVPPPAPPKASSGCFVGAVAVVALLGFGLLATLLSVVDDEPAPPGTTGGAEVPPAGTVLLAEAGSGPLTAVLTTGTAWDLHWSFDCAARPGGTGRFAVDLDGPVPLSGVDERGARVTAPSTPPPAPSTSPSAPAAPGPSPPSPPDRPSTDPHNNLASAGPPRRLPPSHRTSSAGSPMTMKVRQVIRLIEADGWRLARQRGSDRQFRHATKPGRVTIAGNDGDDVKAGTLASILRQARLKEWGS